MSDKLRVVVVDDHALVRAGVKAQISDAVDVVGEADDVEGAIEVVTTHQPDVVLLDVHLPGGNAPAVLAGLQAADCEVPALALSVSDSAEDVIAVIRAGARGYVTKAISADDLIDAVKRVAGGDAVFSPRLAGFVLDAFAEIPTQQVDPELDLLTTREQEVLRLLARGYAYKEIGRRLTISVKTVESHSSAILRKLQLSSRHEVARWATDRRLL